MSIVENSGGSSITNTDKSMSFDTKTRLLSKQPGSSVSEGKSLTAAGGMSTDKRRRKAEAQPRDGGGRWVTAGANVRWNSNGQKWAGTVEAIKNGKAIVKVRHSDGSESTTTLLPSTLAVMKSKARLGSAAKKYHDWQNDSGRWIGEHQSELQEGTEDGKGVVVQREDGYSFEAKKRKDKDGNPLVYQLYAPNGGSLGIYDEGASGEFDDIFEDDKNPGGGEPTNPEGGSEGEGGETPPTAPTAPVVASGEAKSYSVPNNVQEAIRASLAALPEIPEADRTQAEVLCTGEQVTLKDVEWVYEFFEAIKDIENLYGGQSGKKWASKIMDKVESDETSIYEPIQHDFESGALEYFAVDGVSLIGVDFDSGDVFLWDGVTFTGPVGTTETYNAEYIEPLDEFTAREIAYYIHDSKISSEYHGFSTMDAFPEERNLFALAESELDFEEMDRIAKLAYDGYDRARNATAQARGQGGKFGSVPDSKQPTTDKEAVEDVNGAVSNAVEGAEGAEDPMGSAKYFAIVDEVDQSAVLDVVAITQVDGQPSAFKRSLGAWTPDEKTLQSLKSPTPPTIVALGDVDEVKDVLSQIDEYDSGKDAVTASLIQRRFSLTDGSFNITSVTDLIDAVNATTVMAEVPTDVVEHVSRRARALNRMDLIPEHFRIAGQLTANQDLIGEFGEVIVASGAPSGANYLSKLESYWLNGDGAQKIRWTEEGALERAQKTFAKYLGTERAYGFATILHNQVATGE